ncbi:MAG: type III-B CRISPR module RAMP protein Cmr6 [Desulfurococcales archaeon]|nr:type III-B CRISPR module RAMP protein Cmr6 [Desulfurococcales archaeon]
MVAREFSLGEINVSSNLYYALMKKERWKDLLDSNKRPKLRKQMIEKAVRSLKMQANVVCQRTKRMFDDIEQAYRHSGYEVITFEAKLEERGLFGASQPFGIILFEVGLEFDPYLNAPVIPGSSVKGSVRSVWRALFGENEEDIEDYIFGGPQRMGVCMFHDGYPIEAGKNGYLLYPDVLTPHYMKEGRDILKEHEAEPSPLVYLTVAPKTVFKFIIAIPKDIDKKSRSMIRKAVLETLRLGIGGKTNIGYGRFSLRSLHMEVSR